MKNFTESKLHYLGETVVNGEWTKKYRYGKTEIAVSKVRDLMDSSEYIVITFGGLFFRKADSDWPETAASFLGLDTNTNYTVNKNVIFGRAAA